MREHRPLPAVSIPGFYQALAQGTRAIMSLVVLEIPEMYTLEAPDYAVFLALGAFAARMSHDITIVCRVSVCRSVSGQFSYVN